MEDTLSDAAHLHSTHNSTTNDTQVNSTPTHPIDANKMSSNLSVHQRRHQRASRVHRSMHARHSSEGKAHTWWRSAESINVFSNPLLTPLFF